MESINMLINITYDLRRVKENVVSHLKLISHIDFQCIYIVGEGFNMDGHIMAPNSESLNLTVYMRL